MERIQDELEDGYMSEVWIMTKKTYRVYLTQINCYEIEAENEDHAKEIATDEIWGSGGAGYSMYFDVEEDE